MDDYHFYSFDPKEKKISRSLVINDPEFPWTEATQENLDKLTNVITAMNNCVSLIDSAFEVKENKKMCIFTSILIVNNYVYN